MITRRDVTKSCLLGSAISFAGCPHHRKNRLAAAVNTFALNNGIYSLNIGIKANYGSEHPGYVDREVMHRYEDLDLLVYSGDTAKSRKKPLEDVAFGYEGAPNDTNNGEIKIELGFFPSIITFDASRVVGTVQISGDRRNPAR